MGFLNEPYGFGSGGLDSRVGSVPRRALHENSPLNRPEHHNGNGAHCVCAGDLLQRQV